MTNKYNVQLITDVNGKPMPQYYDETQGVMKPITKDNGEITGDIDANVTFPDSQNVNGTVSVDNFPQTQQVEVTNQKEVQDVNVMNQTTSVDVNNFPELQDVSDAQVRAELEQIKQTQSQILKRLNNRISIENQGIESEIETIFNSSIVEADSDTGWIDIDTKGCKRILIGLTSDVEWSLATNSIWSTPASFAHTYPKRFENQPPAPNKNYPIDTVLGYELNNQPSYVEAIRNGFLPNNLRIKAFNRESVDGTMMIKIMRLWEV